MVLQSRKRSHPEVHPFKTRLRLPPNNQIREKIIHDTTGRILRSIAHEIRRKFSTRGVRPNIGKGKNFSVQSNHGDREIF